MSATDAGGLSHGIALVRELIDGGHFVFSSSEALEAASRVGIRTAYVPKLLTSLARQGWVRRIRRGLYATAGRLPGLVTIHPFVVATNLVTPSSISHLSALNFHGLTEQIPLGVTSITTRPVVTPSMRHGEQQAGRHAWVVDGVRYEYIAIRAARYFGIENVWVDEHNRVPITDRERTLLDAFAAPQHIGGIGEAIGILEQHLSEIDVPKLVDYAVRFGNAAVVKRLGYCLGRFGVTHAVLRPLVEYPVTGYRPLDPGGPRRGTCDSRWMIQDNLASGARG